MNSRSIICANHLSKSFGNIFAVRDVSIRCFAGEVVGLLGPNGAGKTTTFYMIVGEIKPDKGSILLNDVDITLLPMYQRARLGIGYLPQEPSIFRHLTVFENILVGAESRSDLTHREMLDLVNSLINEFGLNKVADSKGYTLSGGERRRTEIARSCALELKFFLLDEPFAGIDPIAINEIQNLIKYLKSKGIGIIITDHNVRETLKICDRAYVLVDGQIIAEGPKHEIVRNQSVRRHYLGSDFDLN